MLKYRKVPLLPHAVVHQLSVIDFSSTIQQPKKLFTETLKTGESKDVCTRQILDALLA